MGNKRQEMKTIKKFKKKKNQCKTNKSTNKTWDKYFILVDRKKKNEFS